MYDWTKFDNVFQKASKWTYEQSAVHAISKNRESMDGVLFFDRIWASLALKQADKVYPPKTNQDLRRLFDTIVNTLAPDHQKHALVYYILKDCRPLPDHGETYAAKVYLPRKYKVLISGLHYLDHAQPKQALELLTDPSLTPTFSDQILYALLQNPKVDNSLAMAYFVTVSPPLQDQKTMKGYFSLLCDLDIAHAYYFYQRRASTERMALFEHLIIAALSPKGNDSVFRAEKLIGLPFTDEEVVWFEEILLHGKGSSCHGAKDSVVMRRIATGKEYTDIQALQRYRGQKIDGINWGDVRTSLLPEQSLST